MDSLENRNYGMTDDPNDVGTKCCENCITKLKKSLIGRNPIKSYTVFNSIGKPIYTKSYTTNGMYDESLDKSLYDIPSTGLYTYTLVPYNMTLMKTNKIKHVKQSKINNRSIKRMNKCR